MLLGSQPALAQEQSDQGAAGAGHGPSSQGEVVVTASRRAVDVTKIPYNIAVVNSAQLQSTGVTSLEDLSRQVPNLVVTSSGGNLLGAQRQIMRGLNASASDRRGVAIEQNAVSTYLDNAPYANFFPVKDIERVEVLRGPQGTLYGAGSLGGTIRLIPTAPKLGAFEGSMQASAGLVDHSKDKDYSFEGVINVPIGDTLAIRASASHVYSAGFIDQLGVFVREGGKPLGAPVLVNPFDVAGSAARTETRKDVNYDRSTFVRASVKWQPVSAFSAILAYNYVKSNGYGPNADNPNYGGGPDPFNPSVINPATGKYQIIQRGIEPYNRRSEMWSLDLSYDAGFATLSTTTSFFTTRGSSYYDATLGTAALPPAYAAYYTGTPVNPRFNSTQNFNDHNRVFTQEVRLVSKAGSKFDYTIGVFYQREKRSDFWTGYLSGQFIYGQAPGVTLNSGIGPDDRAFTVGGTQTFTDKAVFGDVTWHAFQGFDLTAGARFFEQTIKRDGLSDVATFLLYEANSHSVTYKDHRFKVNASYEYVPGHQIYGTFSQGFRRGGANAFALSGILFEPAQLLDYRPDSVDNFEVGFKGRFGNGWRYTLDGFIDNWHNPQIGGFTPYNVWPITVNGKEAQTKGIEVELSGNITSELGFSAGYAYTDAKLTKSFCIPVGVGDGVNTDPCGFVGVKGAPLPSAPKHSGTATLNYKHEIGGGDKIGIDLNANYKGSMRQTLPQSPNRLRNPLLPAYWLVNLNLSLEHGPWTASLYARNLFDERPVYSVYTRVTRFEPLDLAETIGRPREIGVTLRYHW